MRVKMFAVTYPMKSLNELSRTREAAGLHPACKEIEETVDNWLSANSSIKVVKTEQALFA